VALSHQSEDPVDPLIELNKALFRETVTLYLRPEVVLTLTLHQKSGEGNSASEFINPDHSYLSELMGSVAAARSDW
jgi:hypothetical protein